MFFKMMVSNPEIPIKHFKLVNNMTRFMFSKDCEDDRVKNEFEMSWEWKPEVKLEGYCKDPREPWQDLDQGSSSGDGEESRDLLDVYEVELTWMTHSGVSRLVQST